MRDSPPHQWVGRNGQPPEDVGMSSLVTGRTLSAPKVPAETRTDPRSQQLPTRRFAASCRTVESRDWANVPKVYPNLPELVVVLRREGEDFPKSSRSHCGRLIRGTKRMQSALDLEKTVFDFTSVFLIRARPSVSLLWPPPSPRPQAGLLAAGWQPGCLSRAANPAATPASGGTAPPPTSSPRPLAVGLRGRAQTSGLCRRVRRALFRFPPKRVAPSPCTPTGALEERRAAGRADPGSDQRPAGKRAGCLLASPRTARFEGCGLAGSRHGVTSKAVR